MHSSGAADASKFVNRQKPKKTARVHLSGVLITCCSILSDRSGIPRSKDESIEKGNSTS